MRDHDPLRLDLPLIEILAGSEVWIEPTDSVTHPLTLSFYVPARLVHVVNRLFRPSLNRGPRPAHAPNLTVLS